MSKITASGTSAFYQGPDTSTSVEPFPGKYQHVTFSRPRYLIVFSTAVLCYAALGAVLGILPDYVHSLGGGAVLVGFAVGAPALTGAAGRRSVDGSRTASGPRGS